jgi:hypothetical protein
MSGHSGLTSDLLANSGTANGLESLYGSNAAGINSTLTPALTAEAVNPQGYSPTQMASMTTGAEQTAGGANAGATGGALLRATRTRNAGAAPAAIDQTNRQGGQELSQINAGIQKSNADLQQHQKQEGISGLEGLYGENVNAGENALGLSNSSLADAGNLKNFWQSLLTQGLQSGSQVAGSALQGAVAAGAG